MEKLPPLEKIYEAYTAVIDGRVSLGEDKATVSSSDGSKSYTITWNGNGVYSSNDNATYWQGYAGYPVIAVLMLQGLLPYHEDIAKLFSQVNWTSLNKKFKRDYAAAVSSVLDEKNVPADQRARTQETAEKTLGLLSELAITLKRSKG